MDPVVPAASAPPEPLSPTETLESLNPSEYQKWKESGEVPVREAVAPVEADDDDEPEPAAAVAPVVGAQPPVPSNRQKKINDQIAAAVKRVADEKDAEIARLRASHAPPKADAPKPAPAPALKADATDPEPDPNNTEKYPGGEYDPKYIRAAAAWDIRQENRQRDAETQKRAYQRHQEQQFRGAAKAASDAFAARTTADPDFAKRLDPRLMASLIPISQLPPDMPGGPLNVIAEEMLAHPDTAPDVAEYFSTHPEDLARLTATDPHGVPLMPARQLIRELGRIEGALQRGVEPPSPPNTITDAPAPPTTLGNRSTSAADPTANALKSGDVAAYMAAENARELAARK